MATWRICTDDAGSGSGPRRVSWDNPTAAKPAKTHPELGRKTQKCTSLIAQHFFREFVNTHKQLGRR